MSECGTGAAPSGLAATSMASISSCRARSGCPETDQATISLLPKSQAGARWALPKESLDSVTSVPIFCQGPSAAKSRPSTFPEVSPTFPLYEPCLWWSVSRRMPHLRPISPVILGTVLSAIRAPSTARGSIATCLWPTPLGSLPKASATLVRSSGLVGAFGCASCCCSLRSDANGHRKLSAVVGKN